MRTFSKGSAESMLSAFEQRIAELESGSDIESATNTCGVCVNPEVITSSEDEGEIDNDYVADLLNDVLDEVSKELSQTGQEIEDGEARLSVVTEGNNMIEFTIPFADLTHNKDEDYQMILDAVQNGLAESDEYDSLPLEEEDVPEGEAEEEPGSIPTDDYLNDHW